jgi:hypothetical protein
MSRARDTYKREWKTTNNNKIKKNIALRIKHMKGLGDIYREKPVYLSVV